MPNCSPPTTGRYVYEWRIDSFWGTVTDVHLRNEFAVAAGCEAENPAIPQTPLEAGWYRCISAVRHDRFVAAFRSSRFAGQIHSVYLNNRTRPDGTTEMFCDPMNPDTAAPGVRIAQWRVRRETGENLLPGAAPGVTSGDPCRHTLP